MRGGHLLPHPTAQELQETGGIPCPHLSICRGGCSPQHLQAMGAWLVELPSSPDPTCLLVRDRGRGLLPPGEEELVRVSVEPAAPSP